MCEMMEAAGHRGRCCVTVCTLLLLMCMFTPSLGGTLQPVEQTCPDGDYLSAKGFCCNRCSPGFKLVDECHAPGLRTNCTRCDAGQYTDEMNHYPNCRSCKRCKKFEDTVQECRRERNTICRCKEGFYKDVIDSETSQCLKCTPCGDRERQTDKCTPEHNTVCECEPGHYRVKRKCLPCKDCTDCELHCPFPSEATFPLETHKKVNDFPINVIAGVGVLVLVILVLVGFITYIATRQYTQRMLLVPQPSDVSPDSTQVLIQSEEPADKVCNTAVPVKSVNDQEPSNLPDCVPLEIKIPELIYAVLDLVPVLQVKQLVRSLGVTDTEIERAETDHRACREAHYQMLRVWAERGSQAGGGGRCGMLHRPLLEELLDKLRRMHLGQATEELETKYGIQ